MEKHRLKTVLVVTKDPKSRGGVVIGAKILTGEAVARITGVQLFLDLVERAEMENLNIFMLGSGPESNNGAYEKLLEIHPNVRIVGRQDGYFSNDQEVVKKINDSKADMLFVALGSPKQEKWITMHRNKIIAPFCMGVGGTFDVVSGNVKRAPKIFQDTGTEWLCRLIREPKRFRRQLVLPKFIFLVLKHKLFGKRSKIIDGAV